MADEAKQAQTMNMQGMMEVYQKLATPGSEHRLLASLAGSWNARMRSWMDPAQPPMESTGSCEQKVILGGRYLQQEYTGEMPGGTFSGIGVTGYDNHKKKYVSTWMDSMGTAILYFGGTGSADGKTITQECRHDDPIRGPVRWRSVTRIVDDNTWVFELYSADQSGAEAQMMEITYTRR